MTEEVARRLIDNVWVTNVEAQGGSGGGGITRVTSDDETVTITNPTGPTVDLSAGGGSQAVKTSTLLVTSAQLLDLVANPVTLVEGVEGEIHFPITIIATTDGGTAYTTDGPQAINWGGITESFGIQGFSALLTDADGSSAAASVDQGAYGAQCSSDVIGGSIRLLCDGVDNTDGDFDVTITVLYQVVTVA